MTPWQDLAAALQARAGEALGEVAPAAGAVHGAGAVVGAGGHDVGPSGGGSLQAAGACLGSCLLLGTAQQLQQSRTRLQMVFTPWEGRVRWQGLLCPLEVALFWARLCSCTTDRGAAGGAAVGASLTMNWRCCSCPAMR